MLGRGGTLEWGEKGARQVAGGRLLPAKLQPEPTTASGRGGLTEAEK